jgi:hypothetical protein
MVREVDDMADDDPQASLGHRHAHRPAAKGGRRRVLLIAVGVLVVSTIAAVLVVLSWDRSGDAVAERTTADPSASTTPSSVAATTPAPTPSETATTPEVPSAFVDAMQQTGIPMDPHTGWDVAQGICVRLGQPQYDKFRMAEGVERLFPSVSDDQAHAFVAMVAESVCHL